MSPLRPALLALALAFPASAEERAAPEYTARRLGSTEQVSLTMLRGRVVLLNTWATWCSPCRKEMPAFEALYRQYRDRGLEMVGVNIDEGQADEQVARYVEAKGIGFPIWRDPENRFAKRFRVLGVPETFLVDRAGRIVRHWQGPIDPHAPDNLKSIQAALAAPAAAGGSEGPRRWHSRGRPTECAARAAARRATGLLDLPLDRQRQGCGTELEGGHRGRAGRRTQGLARSGLPGARHRRPDAEIAAGYAKGMMAGAMPGRKLTEPEVEALVLYLLSLSGERL